MNAKIVLCAFLREDGKYNVWRYDTPQTECLAWGVAASSEAEAKAKALELTKHTGE